MWCGVVAVFLLLSRAWRGARGQAQAPLAAAGPDGVIDTLSPTQLCLAYMADYTTEQQQAAARELEQAAAAAPAAAAAALNAPGTSTGWLDESEFLTVDIMEGTWKYVLIRVRNSILLARHTHAAPL